MTDVKGCYMDDGKFYECGARFIAKDGEYTLMDVGGKPRWVRCQNTYQAEGVKMIGQDDRPYLWDKMAQAPEQEIKQPGKILEYL